MAIFTENKAFSAEQVTLSGLDLNDAPHSFTFNPQRQYLTVVNNDADLTLNFLGDGVTSFICEDAGVIDASAGKDYTVTSGDTDTIFTNKFAGYLGNAGNNVVVTITGSTGSGLATAYLTRY